VKFGEGKILGSFWEKGVNRFTAGSVTQLSGNRKEIPDWQGGAKRRIVKGRCFEKYAGSEQEPYRS